MPKIVVQVRFRTKPGQFDAFVALMKQHAAGSLAEDGCEQFVLMRPVDAGGRPLPETLALVEVYRDQAALDAHNGTQRIADMRAKFSPLLEERAIYLSEAL